MGGSASELRRARVAPGGAGVTQAGALLCLLLASCGTQETAKDDASGAAQDVSAQDTSATGLKDGALSDGALLGDTPGSSDAVGSDVAAGSDGAGADAHPSQDATPDDGGAPHDGGQAKDAGAGAKPCVTAADCGATGAPCTAYTCAPFGCNEVLRPDASICEDGDPCTIADSCVGGVCTKGQVKDCDDGDACTVGQCQANSGSCATTIKTGGSCDDGEPCTANDSCDAKGKCQPGTPICACTSDADCKDDGDLCNGTLYCDKSGATPVCKVNPASVVQCSTGKDTACLVNACDPQSGSCAMTPRPDNTPCDDGVVCTKGDLCKSGTCAPGPGTCCTSHADCPDNGDKCDGVPYCDIKSGLCLVNPFSVVTCATVDDTACMANTCQPKKGVCAMQPRVDGSVCSDGNPCTVGDVCKGGACEGGTGVCQCKSDADCANHEDGDACNGTLFCNKAAGACQVNPSTVVTCSGSQDTACAKNTCDPKSGDCAMVPLPDGVTCDADGSVCTQGDACKGGDCTVGEIFVCECKADKDCVAFEDGDKCNGSLFCDVAAGKCRLNPATIPYCPPGDDTACLKNRCQPKTGSCAMVPLPDGVTCDADSNPCTPHDSCFKGACQASANVCPCQKDGDCAAHEDGSLCTGTLYCAKTTNLCVPNPKTIVTCPSWQDSACQANRCDPKTGKCGMVPVRAYQRCDADGNPCTAYDTCHKGGCVGGANLCDCNLDSQCARFEDQDLCTGKLYCDQGAKPFRCKPNPVSTVTCPAGKGCATQVCDPKTGACGAGPMALGKTCDDGDPCTTNDACAVKGCVGAPKDCGASEVCKTATCDSTTGACALKETIGACDDGSKCTEGEVCKAGKCAGKAVSCDDGNSCTADACDTAKGCVHDSSSTAACDDGDACVIETVCTKGSCGGGVAKQCDDGEPCTKDSCTATKGCVHSVFNDNAPCEGPGGCTTGGICKAGKCQGAIDKLHQRYYDAKGGSDIRAFVRDAIGGAWLIGSGLDGAKTKPTWQGLLVRVDSAGKLTWFKRYGASTLLDRLEGATALANGGLMMVGYHNQGAGSRPWAVAVDTAGQVKASRQFPQWHGQLAAAARLGTTVIACGHTIHGKASPRPFVVGLSATTQLQWKVDDQSGSDARWTAIVADGDAAVLGGDNRSFLALFERRTAKGQVLWRRVLPNTRKAVRVAQITPWPGGLVAAGDFETSAHEAWVMSLDATGRLRWRRDYKPAGAGMLVGGVGVHKSGGIHLFGASGNAARGLRLNIDGVPMGTTVYGHYANRPAVAVVGDDDSVWVAGSGAQGYKGTMQPWTLRLDAFGHATCKAAGVCWGLGSKGCDDGKGCTHDSCASDAGCEHTAASGGTTCTHGQPCSRESTCDTLGSCGAAKPRLGSTLSSAGGSAGGSALSGQVAVAELLEDGTTLEAGAEALKAKGPLVPLLRVRDARGVVSANHRPTGLDGALTAMVVDPGGVASVYGHTASGALLIAHFGGGKTGAARWTANAKWVTQSAGTKPRVADVAATASGWRVAVGTRSDSKGMTQGFAFRTSASYGVGPLVTVGAAPAGSRLDGVRTIGESALMVGQSGAETSGVGWVVLMSGAGATQWQQTYKPASAGGGLRAVVPREGGSLAAGWAGQGAARRVWLLAVDDKGSQLWSREHTLAGGAARALDLAAGVAGGVVGLASLGADEGLVGLFAADGAGHLAWQRQLSSAAGHAANALHLGLNGDLLVAGSRTAAGVTQGEVTRTDAWGNTSCKGSGVCLGLGAVACDDGKPCTADACDAAKGCVSAAIPACP